MCCKQKTCGVTPDTYCVKPGATCDPNTAYAVPLTGCLVGGTCCKKQTTPF